MKPLICPQCGGKITDYEPAKTFAVCNYCETKFIIENEKAKQEFASPEHKNKSVAANTFSKNQIVGAVVITGGIVFGLIVLSMIRGSEKDEPVSANTVAVKTAPTRTPAVSPTQTPEPNPNVLEFGGKGTGDGLFRDADSIAVDKKGRIYVGDETLRVQQFDETGKFLKLWQIPSQTRNYKNARTIDKIAVDAEENLYVAVGGAVLIYQQEAGEPFFTLQNAPDYVTDFALRSDGGVLLVSVNDRTETLFFLNKNKKITRSIKGFHSDTANASMSPPQVGLSAIRLAVDGAGNIFSIYALGDLGSYQLSFNGEDFRIFRFNAQGKYVNKFIKTLESVGIETDNQSRIYISKGKTIEIYSNEGELVSTIAGLNRLDAFALDAENNIYVLQDDRVVKRAAFN